MDKSNKAIDELTNTYMKFLEEFIITSERDLDLIIKSHFLLESTINLILRIYFPKFEKIEYSNFSKKCDLLVALDILPSHITDSIYFFNTIRNKFAHDINYKFENVDRKNLKKFISLMFGKEGSDFQKKFEGLESVIGVDKYKALDWDLKKMSPRIDYMTAHLSLVSYLSGFIWRNKS